MFAHLLVPRLLFALLPQPYCLKGLRVDFLAQGYYPHPVVQREGCYEYRKVSLTVLQLLSDSSYDITTSCGEISRKFEVSSGWMVCSISAYLARVCADCSIVVSNCCTTLFPSLRVSEDGLANWTAVWCSDKLEVIPFSLSNSFHIYLYVGLVGGVFLLPNKSKWIWLVDFINLPFRSLGLISFCLCSLGLLITFWRRFVVYFFFNLIYIKFIFYVKENMHILKHSKLWRNSQGWMQRFLRSSSRLTASPPLRCVSLNNFNQFYTSSATTPKMSV